MILTLSANVLLAFLAGRIQNLQRKRLIMPFAASDLAPLLECGLLETGNLFSLPKTEMPLQISATQTKQVIKTRFSVNTGMDGPKGGVLDLISQPFSFATVKKQILTPLLTRNQKYTGGEGNRISRLKSH